MSNKFIDAAQTLERQAVKYEALMQAAAALKEIGSLEQAAAEQQAAANIAKQASEQARGELANLVDEIERIKIKRAAKIKEIEDITAKAIFTANEQASAILKMAESQAEKIKFDITNQAQSQANGIARQINDLQGTKAKLDSEITALQDRVRSATDEANAAEQRLAKVKESIAKLALA
jgi:predicted  nucleic acid-binding Zn-ribbon protein